MTSPEDQEGPSGRRENMADATPPPPPPTPPSTSTTAATAPAPAPAPAPATPLPADVANAPSNSLVPASESALQETTSHLPSQDTAMLSPSQFSHQPGALHDQSAEHGIEPLAENQRQSPKVIFENAISQMGWFTNPSDLNNLPSDLNNLPARPLFPPAPPSISTVSIPPTYTLAAVVADGLTGFGTELPQGVHSDEDEDDLQPPDDMGVYGRLEFPDSTTWITTRTVLIGRDQKVFMRARRERAWDLKKKDHEAKGLPPPHQPRSLRSAESRRLQGKSFASEVGGALGPESDGEDDGRPAKRRKMQRDSQEVQKGRPSNIINSRQYVDEAPAPVDVSSLKSQDEIAEIKIHGEGPDMWFSTKGISRSHLKISYNEKQRVWQATVLGRNGVFCRSQHHKEGDVFTLRSGDELQIQYIVIFFYLTNVKHGMTGAETYYENGKEMSFDFQSSNGKEMRDTDDSSEIAAEELKVVAVVSDDSEDSDQEMQDAPSPVRAASGEPSNGEEEIRETVESDHVDGSLKPESSPDDAETLAQVPLPPKKRGPGRPPKNGIMSKREERLLRKQMQEEAKRNMPPQEPGDQPQKRKVGRPRKHPLPEGADGQAEKRKYKPRKPKGEEGEEDAEGDKPTKERSLKHKTPPLELKREDFTEEQLQKPTKNYQLLIDEIMTAAPPKGYSLKQVYKRIQERWPYFYFCVDTKGWESSVRHNLLGSECFQKIEGNWHRVPGVPLESGKKRKPSDAMGEPRPAGMYNGYSHPYQPPSHVQHHGQHATTQATNLTPNLPPRYPPNGQAYQIPHGHSPSTAPPPRVAPNQQGPPRPVFPQQHTSGATPQANGYTAAPAPPRPQPSGAQVPSYNPAHGNRPPPPHVATQSPVVGPNPAHHLPAPRAGQGPPPTPQLGTSNPHVNPPPNAPRSAAPPHSQPTVQSSAPTTALAPVIEPLLKVFIREFRAEVIRQLHSKEGERSEAVAMSVINRGLGLTERSLVPDLESYENLILPIFRHHKLFYPKRRAEEIAQMASKSSTPVASIKPPVNGASPVPTADARTGAPPAAPNATGCALPLGAKASAGNVVADTKVQQTGSTSTPGPRPTGDVNGAMKSNVANNGSDPANSTAQPPVSSGPLLNAPATAASGIPSPVSAGPKPSTPSHASNPVPNAPLAAGSTAPASALPPAHNPITGANVAGPEPQGAGPGPSTSAIGGSAAPASTSAGPAPTTTVTKETTAPKLMAPKPVPSAPGITQTPVSKPVPTGPIATPPAANPIGPPKPVSAGVVPASESAPPKPVSVSPAPAAPITSAATPSGSNRVTSAPVASVAPGPGPGPGPGLSRPVSAAPPVSASSAVAAVNGAGSKVAASTGTPATPGKGSPVQNGPRSTSATPGPRSTPGPSKDVELLDPKLVNVILSFKKSILPTLAEKLDPLTGESLVMSAVDQVLGFIDETFVMSESEQQKQHFAAAEKALMLHLETRFGEYLRNRSAHR